jgi:glycosyltransferase involved in cell wall biosynthesis
VDDASASLVPRTRVLYFVGSFEQGGAERQTAELVKNLPHERFEAHVAVCNTQDDLGYELAAASFTDLGTPDGPNMRTFIALARLARRIRPDVIHAVHDPQNSYARVVARAVRCASVGTLLCTRLPRRTIRREWLTHRFGDALIVNSTTIRTELLQRARIAPVDVVANGVDGGRFRRLSGAVRGAARARWHMEGVTFVVPGRISEQKNQRVVIEAVADLRRRDAWPKGARVVLAGRVEAHSRYVTEVDRAIQDQGVSDCVARIAHVRDVEVLLGAADATLLPSRYEGLPNVVLESLACQTPVIVSNAANADGLVEDGVTGLVTDVDAASVARGMLRFFRTRADETEAMGKRGRADVLARFDIARMVNATCAIYDRVT